jgi:hypothetical protein
MFAVPGNGIEYSSIPLQVKFTVQLITEMQQTYQQATAKVSPLYR